MVKKLEHARASYYCAILMEIDVPNGHSCHMDPEPDCRKCVDRKELEQKAAYVKERNQQMADEGPYGRNM